MEEFVVAIVENILGKVLAIDKTPIILELTNRFVISKSKPVKRIAPACEREFHIPFDKSSLRYFKVKYSFLIFISGTRCIL